MADMYKPTMTVTVGWIRHCLDNDVTNVPVDGYVRVPSGRHVQTNYDRDLSPADGYVEVTGDCLDNDVTNVPVDGYVRVPSDRQIHRNLNPAINDDTDVLVDAINDDTDVQWMDNTQDTASKKINAINDDTDVLVNTQDPTVMYHAERDLQVHDGGNTSQLIPKGI